MTSTTAEPTHRSTATNMTERMIRAARTRFFPGWWIHAIDAPELVTNKPFYRVIVDTEEDAVLARASKPDYIDAKIELVKR